MKHKTAAAFGRLGTVATEAKYQQALTPSRRATGGFTLVELIVAMTISLIIIGIASAILLSGTNMAQRTAQRALEEQIVDGVFNFAKDRLLYAGTVDKKEETELSSAISSGTGLLYVSKNGTAATDRGMLFFRDASDSPGPPASDPINVMGTDFYMGYTISLEAKLTNTKDKKPVIFIRVNLHSKTNSDQIIAKRELTFTLINGEVNTVAVLDDTVSSPQFLSFGPRETVSAPTP
jgi:prepilin-type N-terminal cleavage/methylation domain-containing protein